MERNMIRKKIALMYLYALVPAFITGVLFSVLLVGTFGVRNYKSIGGWSMWFLLAFVVSYAAMMWAYTKYVYRHANDPVKEVIPKKPLNKWIKYGYWIFWCLLFFLIATFILPHFLFALAWFPDLLVRLVMTIFGLGIIILPVVGIGFCLYGLRTMDHDRESGFRRGIIQIVLLAIFEILMFLPWIILGWHHE